MTEKFQLEVITQEPQTLFDLLGLGLRPGEPEKVVVGVAQIPQPAVTGIIRILAGQAEQLPTQRSCSGTVTVPPGSRQTDFHLPVGRVALSPPASGVFRDQDLFDDHVQLVQINVGQDR